MAAATHLEPKGIVILAPNARPEIKDTKKVVVEKAVEAGDSDSVVARQNQLNEKEQAQGNIRSVNVQNRNHNFCVVGVSDSKGV